MRQRLAVMLLAASGLFPQTQPVDPRAQLDAGIAAAQAGKTDMAVKYFNTLLRGNPPFEIAGQAHLELARIHQARGDRWGAVAQWEALRKMAPKEPEYAYQLGLAYQSLSTSAIDRLRAIAPESARMQQTLGEHLAVMGRQEKAIAAFERAIAADPKLQGPHLALAVIYLQAGKRDEALAEIDRELAIAPESAAAKQLRQAVAGGAKP